MIRYARTAAAVMGFALSSVGCGDPGAERADLTASGPADPTDARAVAAGEAIYLPHCASCHGTQLEGQPNWREALPDGGHPAPPHDGRGHTWRHADAPLFEATKFGGSFSAAPGTVSHMPAFEHVLSDDEIWAAIAYVKSHWPAALLARQRLLTRMPSRQRPAGHEGHAGHAVDSAE